jgi:hypothetical protein
MASGHVNRANRPNTWLHRPMLLREKSSCQLGALHTWPNDEVPGCRLLCRSWSVGRHGGDTAFGPPLTQWTCGLSKPSA